MRQTYRILLADDHAVVRSGLRNALEVLPEVAVVGEVGDGLSLFEALAEGVADCLLIDVDMPHFRPIADTQRIRADYPTLKILVVSAHDDDVYVQGLLAAGVDGYHMKDESLADLRLAVQRVLSGQRWVTGRLLDKLLSTPQAAPDLTQRQRGILRLLHEGLDNQAIARQTGLSVKTVENHLTRIYRQLDVQSRLEAVHFLHHHPGLLQSPTPAPLPRTPKSAATPFTLLLVDDNAGYRRQLRRMLASIQPSARIVEAGYMAEATTAAQQHAVQFAFVDVVLGEESGIECTRRLRALPHPPRVVLITAYPDREFHRRGLAAGAMALLDKKDLNAAVLRQMIADFDPAEG